MRGESRRNRAARGVGVICSAAVLAMISLSWVAMPKAGARSQATSAVDPTQPTLRWGGHVRPTGTQSEIQAVQALEQKTGRKLGADREFRLWDTPFPTSFDTWLRDTGHLVLLSVKPQRMDGSKSLWRDIAAAQPGSALQNQIVGWAQKVKAWGIPIEFTFHHEPETVGAIPFGTAADFIAAWRHVVDTFRSQGVTNARYLWIMTDFGYDWPTTDRRYAPKWYPGDAWVDDMGIDAYNWYHCRPGILTAWKSLGAIIESFRQFGTLHPTKRLWLPEWASAEDPLDPARKPQWIADARALFKQPGYEQFDGISYFDLIDSSGYPDCNWHVDSTAQSLTAIRTMGADPFYRVGIVDPPPPPSGAVLLVVGDSTNMAAGDSAVRNHLAATGWTVTVADDNAHPGSSGYQAVLLSSTTDLAVIAGNFDNVPQAVVTWKPWLYGELGMTGMVTGSYGINGGTTLTITNPSSPLAAGRSGTVTVVSQSTNLPWGQPAASASVAGTRGGHPILFSYATGALLSDGRVAAGCRIAAPAYHTSPAAPTVFTADGWALFDAAVTTAAAC